MIKRLICIPIYLFSIGSVFYTLFIQDWLGLLYALISLLLYALVEKGTEKIQLVLSDLLKIILHIFIFFAVVLGSIYGFYTYFSWWDSLLHGTTGFLCAAVGLSLANLFGIEMNKAPLFKFLVALFFSMTVGIFWEFYEFSVDRLLVMNVQKDTLVNTVTTNFIYDESLENPQTMNNIEKIVIYHDDDHVTTIEGGMLDIGLFDTIKDQAVHLAGTSIFFILCIFFKKQSLTTKLMITKKSKKNN